MSKIYTLIKRTLIVGLAGVIGYRIHERGWRTVEGDLIDHPLMTLYPKLGDYLYNRPDGEVRAAIKALIEMVEEP